MICSFLNFAETILLDAVNVTPNGIIRIFSPAKFSSAILQNRKILAPPKFKRSQPYFSAYAHARAKVGGEGNYLATIYMYTWNVVRKCFLLKTMISSEKSKWSEIIMHTLHELHYQNN